jgi:F-type H+-transporting ATPase subunit epsilon
VLVNLRIVTVRGVEVDVVVGRVTAESLDGSFTLLPRHLDLVAPLVTGLIRYRDVDAGAEHAVAIEGGTLVKQGALVSVATRWVVVADTTEELERAWRSMTVGLDEHEHASRSALQRLEHDLVTRLLESEVRR